MASRYTGFTPKKLQRVRRFQTACNQMIHQRPVDLVDVANDNSFTDQAHFTKEFREFSGAPPGTFLRERATIKENTRYDYF